MTGESLLGGAPAPPGALHGAPLVPIATRLRPTASGTMLLGYTAVAFVAAWFGGGAMFSVLAASGGALCLVAAISTWRHASGLRVAAPPPVTAFAGERFTLDVPLTNLARHAVAFDVLFSLDAPNAGARHIGALVPRIAAGAALRVDVIHPLLRRGLHEQGELHLESSFPLGLWSEKLRFRLPEPILVLPRLGTLRYIDRRSPRSRGPTLGGSAGRGDEQEIYGIRDWREGEGLRTVHWKLSARRGRLLVREFRNQPLAPVHVVLATRLAKNTRIARRLFEDAVSLAATLLDDHVRRGHTVRLTLLGRDPRTITCRRGRAAIVPALRALALVKAETGSRGQVPVLSTGRRRSMEKTYLVRVAAAAGLAAPEPSLPGGGLTVFDVSPDGLTAVFDRRRRPGRDLLLGAST